MSELARQLDYYTLYTPANKRAVSVNAFKSALPHFKYLPYGKLLNRDLQIFTNAVVPSKNKQHKVFYNLFTLFGDYHGYNVEDGYIVNEKLDFDLSILYNYNLIITELDTITVTIPSQSSDLSVLEYSTVDYTQPISTHLHICTLTCSSEITFYQFTKFQIYKVPDIANYHMYHIYIIRNDEMFSSMVKKKLEPKITIKQYRFVQNNHKKLGLNLTIEFKCDKFYGLKLNNCYGQKGVIRPMNLSHLKYQDPDTLEWKEPDVITNNCSFVSRAANGQLMEMREPPYGNIRVINTLCNTDIGLGGYCKFFIVENTPAKILTYTSPLKLEPMSAMALTQIGLTLSLNVKYNLDNIHNQEHISFPPDSRQTLSLYSCLNASLIFNNDNYTGYPFTSHKQIDYIKQLYAQIVELKQELQASEKQQRQEDRQHQKQLLRQQRRRKKLQT
jgi:hypothetical protein